MESEAPAPNPLTWEEFKRAATVEFDGRSIFIVEWDQAVSEEELHERYEAYVAGFADDGLGEVEQRSIVNDIGASDDIWQNDQQLNLTYCVSNAFGANKTRRAERQNLAPKYGSRVEFEMFGIF